VRDVRAYFLPQTLIDLRSSLSTYGHVSTIILRVAIAFSRVLSKSSAKLEIVFSNEAGVNFLGSGHLFSLASDLRKMACILCRCDLNVSQFKHLCSYAAYNIVEFGSSY